MIIRTESTDFRMHKNRIPIFHSPMLGGGQQEILWVGLTDKLTVKKKKKKARTQHNTDIPLLTFLSSFKFLSA